MFSKSTSRADWNNTTLLKGDLATELRNLKQQDGEGMCIMGIRTIVAQLAQENLIGEYQIALNAIILGKGGTLCDGVRSKINLKLTSSRAFKNGNVFLTYEPAAS